MKKQKWNVCLNGRMPALRQFDTFNEAVHFVSVETGAAEDDIRKDNAAGCPTTRGDNDYDIEKAAR